MSEQAQVVGDQFGSGGGPMNVAKDMATAIQINVLHRGQGEPHVPPRHLPPSDAHFVNREQQLAELLLELRPGSVVTLCGPGGIGKTALAARAVRNLDPDRFPDGILFHSFYKQPDPNLALEYITLTFGVAPTPTLAIAAQRALAGKHALLILDGAEEANDLSPVLNIRGDCGVLITSRRTRDALSFRRDIPPLDEAAATELLRAWSAARLTDEHVTQRICELLGGLPLAIRIVGHYLEETGESASDYLQWLEHEPIKELDRGEHREESVAVLLRRSVAQVSLDALQVLSLAGVLAFAPFAKEPFAIILDNDARRARDALNELLTFGLLIRSGDRYEVSHALIHTYVHKYLNIDDEIIGRLVAYYTTLTKTVISKGLDGYHHLDHERTHLLRLVNECVKRKKWDDFKKLSEQVKDYLHKQGYTTEYIMIIHDELIAAQQLGDNYAEWISLYQLSQFYLSGQPEKAIQYSEQALALARKLDDSHCEAISFGEKGKGYEALDQFQKAIECYEQALSINLPKVFRDESLLWLDMLGRVYEKSGQTEKAIENRKRFLAVCQSDPGLNFTSSGLETIGDAYKRVGQVEKAVEYYERALLLQRANFKESYDKESNYFILYHQLLKLGDIHNQGGVEKKALDCYEQALAISRENGNRLDELKVLIIIGNIYHKKAGSFINQEIITQSQNGLRGNSITLRDTITLEEELSKKAREYFEQALEITRTIGNLKSEGILLKVIGQTYALSRDMEKTIQYLQASLDIFKRIKDPDAKDIQNAEDTQRRLHALHEVNKNFEDLKKEIKLNEVNSYNTERWFIRFLRKLLLPVIEKFLSLRK